MVCVAVSVGIGVTFDCVYAAKIDKLWVGTRESTDRRRQCESCGQRFHFTRMEAGLQNRSRRELFLLSRACTRPRLLPEVSPEFQLRCLQLAESTRANIYIEHKQ